MKRRLIVCGQRNLASTLKVNEMTLTATLAIRRHGFQLNTMVERSSCNLADILHAFACVRAAREEQIIGM
jgi:hypothetical protein